MPTVEIALQLKGLWGTLTEVSVTSQTTWAFGEVPNYLKTFNTVYEYVENYTAGRKFTFRQGQNIYYASPKEYNHVYSQAPKP